MKRYHANPPVDKAVSRADGKDLRQADGKVPANV